MDILPTALRVSGLPVPGTLDGRSLRDAPRPMMLRPLFWRYDNMAAMRAGRWKLLRYPDRPAELYDLTTDIGETRDLAASEPERVRAG